ncbi:hypothetical protein D5086_008846 [Populus alba]|uniref:Uncharacterized protein n=1 Tax=Populus alba TaxID=43335 RepID=A0ACC4CGK2_POPAL
MANPDANNQDEAKKFPIAGLVLLPSFGILLIIVIALGFIYWKRNRLSGTASHGDSSLSDLEIISIPGLPVRFNYEDLVAATENFSAQIGSGGFGTVYKGKTSQYCRSTAGNDMSSASSGWEPRPAYSPLLHASERKVLGACKLQARKACDQRGG